MIQELHAGDRQIPASGWNEMRAAVQGITAPQQQYQSGKLNPVYITVKNVTGAALPAFSVVRLSGATYTRTGDAFVNQAIANGVELNGDTPAAATDTIAITQAACAAGEFVKAIVSGATPAKVYKASNKQYQYAQPAASQSEYLTGTDSPTGIRVLWLAGGTGSKEAYVCLDAPPVDARDYFIINYGLTPSSTAVNDYSVYTAGSLHYIIWSGDHWEPAAANEQTPNSSARTRPSGSRLVVCQETAAGGAQEQRLHYYALEDNIGVPADYTGSYLTYDGVYRCGVLPGEHALTDRCLDYVKSGGAYIYEPQFIVTGIADGQTGGTSQLYITLNSVNYECAAPIDVYNTMLFQPDIYPGDYIVTLFNCETYTAQAIDYPIDYRLDAIQLCYCPSTVTTPTAYAPGRGWVYSPYNPSTRTEDWAFFVKTKTGAIL